MVRSSTMAIIINSLWSNGITGQSIKNVRLLEKKSHVYLGCDVQYLSSVFCKYDKLCFISSLHTLQCFKFDWIYEVAFVMFSIDSFVQIALCEHGFSDYILWEPQSTLHVQIVVFFFCCFFFLFWFSFLLYIKVALLDICSPCFASFCHSWTKFC